MEVVLEKAEGVPEGGVLSIKVGDTKRQGPVAKIGQPFRFANSPAEPLPIQVEVLTPAAAPKEFVFDPSKDRFVVDFGGNMKVTLLQRQIQELQRQAVDVKSAAEARGLGPDKAQMAQRAAAYLEEHDLVRTFQEILHGLLVSKPADPHAYVEERLARAKKLAAKVSEKAAAPSQDAPATASSTGSGRHASGGGGRASVRLSQRGSVASRGKVDTLLMTLQSAQDNLPLVTPFMPDDLRRVIESKSLAEECAKQFKSLDTQGTGRLSPDEMVHVITHLTMANLSSVGSDQCRKFVDMFDSDSDGMLNMEDFLYLVQFVIVAGWLESAEGRQVVEMAMLQENAFNDFIAMIEGDKERLWSIIPFLPEWLVEHVSSSEFQNECVKQFAALDVDQNGSLEPGELIPVIQSLSEAHPLTIDLEKCRRFTGIFDTHKNGVIMQDEFVEFAQFVTVMNFLANTTEGQQLSKRADHLNTNQKTLDFIAKLEDDSSILPEVLRNMPQALVGEISTAAFKDSCTSGFDAVDKAGTGVCEMEELVPLLCKLSEKFAFTFTQDFGKRYVSAYDKKKQGVVSKDNVVQLAQFVTVLAYLNYAKEHQEMVEAEVLLGQQRIQKLLCALREGVDQIADIIPFLPPDLLNHLLGDEFAARCATDFKDLDKDTSGVLEPKELMPIIMNLVEANHLSLTEEHARQFVDVFDSERNAVITQGEFVNFVRFMMIMAFMETEDGATVHKEKELVQGGEAVEELLQMLEQDRKAVHKVVPLLPPDIYNELTGDDFVVRCHERFVELDKDKTGVLRPHELYPVVSELCAAQPYAVTEEQCKRFTAIFDLYGDGVLRPDEFLDFTRFLCIMSYLHTPDGKTAARDALVIISDSRKIEDLLDAMEKDRKDVNRVIPYLPEWLRDDLLSDHFTVECLSYFKDLDNDGNGTLEPEELFPMVLSLSQAQKQSLDIDQCRRFTAIFDDAKNGVITKNEFVEFSRFLIIMGYLRSQEGQQVLDSVWAGQRPASPKPASADEAPLSSTALVAVQDLASPSSTAHLAVDCDFYQQKSEKLATENEQLRERMLSLEALVRKMEQKMEDQGRTLRHAEVDLQTTCALR